MSLISTNNFRTKFYFPAPFGQKPKKNAPSTQKKKKSRNYGHFKGLDSVEQIIKASIKKEISFLTLYTFSTENWRRPQNEINFLFDLIRKSLKKNIKKILNQVIKVNVIGSNKGLPNDIKITIKFIKRKTLRNNTITLNLALNYGSKEEIINACKKLKQSSKKIIWIRT